MRIVIAGDVDNGKSTLVGRLLQDADALYDDHLAALQARTAPGEAPDLSLVTDGLIAERERRITIDVAYQYFSRGPQRYVIADTPGHGQYTRSMATGCSTADLCILLVDATLGVTAQIRRHLLIASLLRVQHVIVAINKMDLVGWSQSAFEEVHGACNDLATRLEFHRLDYLPVSAATGDNVVKPSRKMQWHAGAPLLTQLEAVKATSDRGARALRFPVQRVVGVHPNFRGYAGTIVSGAVRLGDPVVALPSRRRTSIRNILDGRGARDFALAGTPVTLELADDIGLNRGDLLAAPEERPQSARQLEVNMIWMSRTPLRSGKPYWVKQTTNWVHAFADVEYRLALDGSRSEGATGLQLNEIGGVSLELSRPLVVDTYKQNRQTGSLIVVDPETGETAAAGMVI